MIPEALLQVTVDCVLGLGDQCLGRSFCVRGVVLPGPAAAIVLAPFALLVPKAKLVLVANRARHVFEQRCPLCVDARAPEASQIISCHSASHLTTRAPSGGMVKLFVARGSGPKLMQSLFAIIHKWFATKSRPSLASMKVQVLVRA